MSMPERDLGHPPAQPNAQAQSARDRIAAEFRRRYAQAVAGLTQKAPPLGSKNTIPPVK
jgi:hypothetical protein